ncbi:hypothetical protein KUTeg_020079 [Tegillarca granosa]|uniref:Domain of unknown function with conserved HDNR motif domain-containing protein n=1 Tax=Tegillarca granosa TaxID=220873 RepID=A0ABQ9EBZ9_TEGGR|nr:hypothetical protein KUTeg_020079 [Tegillarca granosa]
MSSLTFIFFLFYGCCLKHILVYRTELNMTAATEIVGSWFPTGYHGHFRSKSENDFVCEYRQLAKPIPPKRFLNRSRQPSARHVFSHHDNREAFRNDAILFTQGLGKKRTPGKAYSFNADFITWMPEKEYIERSRPLISSYKIDYRQNIIQPQIIVKRPKTSFEGVPTTSYRYAHGTDAPNKEIIDAANNESLKLSLLNRKNRAMSAKVVKGRESVASCMIWYNPNREKTCGDQQAVKKSNVPPATQMVVYEPHPPPPKEPATQVIQTAPVQPPPSATMPAPQPQTSATVSWPQPNPAVQQETKVAQRPMTAMVKPSPSYAGPSKSRSMSARPVRKLNNDSVASSLIWHDMWKTPTSTPVLISYDPHLPPSKQITVRTEGDVVQE